LLKITIDESPSDVTLRLEGRVAGPWVFEFRRAWQSVSGRLGTRSLVVDLGGVTHVDAAGRESLTEVHEQTGARFLADTPMTKYFADEACKRGKHEGTKRGG
jgi:anti-anti-sigma regulatory factor